MEAYHRLNSAIVESGTVASVEALIWFLEFIQIKKSPHAPHALFFNGRQVQEFSSVKAAENAESRRQRRINELKRVL